MFKNIGGKIKTLAEVICWLGIISSVIYGIVLIAQGGSGIVAGFLMLILGPLSSWIGSFLLYGFGQLIENTDILVTTTRKTVTQDTPKLTFCSKCGMQAADGAVFCRKCGNKLSQ